MLAGTIEGTCVLSVLELKGDVVRVVGKNKNSPMVKNLVYFKGSHPLEKFKPRPPKNWELGTPPGFFLGSL